MFGRRVLQAQGPPFDLRDCGLEDLAAGHQLGNAEIEQAHLPIPGHENVGGFQVAMEDGVAVGILDGSQRLFKKLDPGVDAQLPGVAPGGERFAFDVLQSEIRPPVRGRARIVQAGDVRMGKAGEDVALAREALHELVPRKLQSYLSLERAVIPPRPSSRIRR